MELLQLRIVTQKGRKEVRHWACDRFNDTFALHRDANLANWNITHRPSGYAMFIGGIDSLSDARRAFDRLSEHHKQTGQWAFTSAARAPKGAKQFGKDLRVEFGLPSMEASR